MIDEAVDRSGTNLVEARTLQVPIDLIVGSESNKALLNHYQDANSKNLQNEYTHIAIDAVWQLNNRQILAYSVINALPFLLYAPTSVFLPDFTPLVYLTLVVNFSMLFFEVKEMRLRGIKYW